MDDGACESGTLREVFRAKRIWFSRFVTVCVWLIIIRWIFRDLVVKSETIVWHPRVREEWFASHFLTIQAPVYFYCLYTHSHKFWKNSD